MRYLFAFCVIFSIALFAKDAEMNKNDVSACEVATFAGGCFWCLQPVFDAADGVVKSYVGYTGGTTKNPTYEEVCSGKTGHVEAIEIYFDPTKTTFEKILQLYWENIDPTRSDGQFTDKGPQYKPIIFYHSEMQQKIAEVSKKKLVDDGLFPSIAVEISAAKPFYIAEEYHQNYCEKNSIRYELYHKGSKRDEKLKALWNN